MKDLSVGRKTIERYFKTYNLPIIVLRGGKVKGMLVSDYLEWLESMKSVPAGNLKQSDKNF